MPSKYRNVRTVVDGITFDSAAEARRYEQLKLLEIGGAILDLELQPRYEIKVNNHKVCVYVADFRYVETATGEVMVEDVKGVRTALYKLKRKLVKAVHGIDIYETTA